MPRFIVDLELDGYNTDEEREAACIEFIEDQLDFSASSVKVSKFDTMFDKLFTKWAKNTYSAALTDTERATWTQALYELRTVVQGE